MLRHAPRTLRFAAACIWLALTLLVAAVPAAAHTLVGISGLALAAASGTDVTGTLVDSLSNEPLPSAEVGALRDGRVVAKSVTDAFGRFELHDLAPGAYLLSAHMQGYRPGAHTFTVDAGAPEVRLTLGLRTQPIAQSQVQVLARSPVGVDTRSGDQTFQQNAYHGAPSTTSSQILQQSIVGAVRAPTGEVHIRGQHAEYTYYIDGVPVSPGISGSLNEIFDPAVVDHIEFKTGGWDAEFGNKNAAVVSVATRVPAGGTHVELSGYGGSFDANGEGVTYSHNAGRFGAYFSAQRQSTAMRIDPVVADPMTGTPINYHNHGTDLFGFGKLQYRTGVADLVNLDANWSRTTFEVPFDSTAGASDDSQRDLNGFANLSWRHQFVHAGDAGAASPAELFVAGSYRQGSLRYTPGANDDPAFVFYPDPTPYTLREDRSFHSIGGKADYTRRLAHDSSFKCGVQGAAVRGNEDFATRSAEGQPGPASLSQLRGSDLGAYAQVAIAPTERWEIRTGVRGDRHTAPFAGTRSQISPRLKFSLFPNPSTTAFAYYGRLFVPTNIEDLRAVTSVADSGVVADPTVPERDDFYEIGVIRRFPSGFTAKASVYHKRSAPGIDDNTVPGSAIVTSVNIAEVRITGIETTLDMKIGDAFTAYLNAALNHAWGRGTITGGFFPADTPDGSFDLDHDQRMSLVGSGTYSQRGFTLSATGIYGSGLTNGADPDASDGTGLFDFNKNIHVAPNFVLNASAGYAFAAGTWLVRPELYVDNALGSKYLLKGAFFSGPSVGRPRSIQLRVRLGS